MQTIRINKFRSFGKQVATYLRLPSPEKYTGHCLRRSSATIFTDGGGGANTIDLKLHGGWKSSSVTESCVERSITNKMNTATEILQQVLPCSSSAPNVPTTPVNFTNSSNCLNINNNSSSVSNSIFTSYVDFEKNSIPCINITNCQNITFNFNSK